MLPVLLDLKFVKIYTFGVFLVLAFFWGIFLLWKNIKLTPHKEEDIFDGLFLAFFCGLFFGRLIFVLLNFKQFGFDIFKIILINGYPGMSLLGSLLGGFIFLLIYFHVKKIDFLAIIDYFIPSVFLSLAIGKLGSFFAGVDVGTKTNLFLSINYFGLNGKRHLVGLYEGLLFGLGVYFVYQILMAVRRELFPKGFAFYFFCLYFSVVTLLLDKFKSNHLYFLDRSFNLFFSLILSFVIGIYFIYYFGKLPSFQKQINMLLNGFKYSFFNYGKKTYQIITGKIKKRVDKAGKKVDKTD